MASGGPLVAVPTTQKGPPRQPMILRLCGVISALRNDLGSGELGPIDGLGLQAGRLVSGRRLATYGEAANVLRSMSVDGVITVRTMRTMLISQLERHAARDTNEAISQFEILKFLRTSVEPFSRSRLTGHITGSAIVAAPDRRSFLILHHPRLGRWLQPGGHVEPEDRSILDTAIRETWEESGLRTTPFDGKILDVDHHVIPRNDSDLVAAHIHYDIRYLLKAHTSELGRTEGRLHFIGTDQLSRFSIESNLARALRKAEGVLLFYRHGN
jgi:8-oxo-dGTP pyrophosphatase MutT (NUDIX family)